MKFLANQCVYRKIVEELKNRGYDIVDVRDLELKGAKDEDILDIACKQERIIITFDKDFSDVRKFPVGTHSGIIWIKRGKLPVNRISKLLEDFLKKSKLEEIRGSLVIISREKIRIKKLKN